MPRACVLTIGNFDGVHLGHRAILDLARGFAGRNRVGPPLEVTVLTFDPHPAGVLRPGREPARLMSPSMKARALHAAGADRVEVMATTRALLSLSPEQFLRRVAEDYRPAAIVEGPDFRFGAGRSGDLDSLRHLGRELGFQTLVAQRFHVGLSDLVLLPVTSSLVRWLLGLGRVGDAARCLGHPYTLSGQVVRADRRGTSIGIPTANLDPLACLGRVVPGEGVYAGWVRIAEGQGYPAAISVGAKPTFGRGDRVVVEAHLLGFDGDLYDQPVTVGFERWLRDQRAFPDVPALLGQVKRDIQQTRQWLTRGLLEACSGSDHREGVRAVL